MTIKSYRDLRVWQAAMELAEWVYRVTREFPRPETYGMTAQLRRGATQIPSRIAEGHSSEDLRDYLSQLSKAQALLADRETQTLLAERLGYLQPEQVERTIQQTESLGKQLYSLRNALRRDG